MRRVRKIDDDTADMTIRSLLPYDLTFISRQTRCDPDALVLEVSMAGDLSGYSRWRIAPTSAGARAVFEEDVVAEKPLLRRFALLARPAFRANHTLMMRHGQHGLRTYLAGYRARIRLDQD